MCRGKQDKLKTTLFVISEKLTVRYYGQFRIPKLKYLASYSDDTSAEYVELAKDVKTKVC